MTYRNRKLTEGQVRDIYKSKKTCTELAKKYKVSIKTISVIKAGKQWRDVTVAEIQGAVLKVER